MKSQQRRGTPLVLFGTFCGLGLLSTYYPGSPYPKKHLQGTVASRMEVSVSVEICGPARILGEDCILLILQQCFVTVSFFMGVEGGCSILSMIVLCSYCVVIYSIYIYIVWPHIPLSNTLALNGP